MSLQNVQNWVNGLPSVELNQPLVILNGMAYTPSQALDEVRRGTAAGRQLQTIIEQKKFTAVMDKYGLAVLRLQQRLGQTSANVVVGTQTYTPQQLLQEVSNGTPLGRQLIESEMTNVAQVLS